MSTQPQQILDLHNRQSKQHKYVQLKNFLVGQMAESRLRPGDSLPTEGQMAKSFSIARSTVRQALGELEREGLIRREQGKGTFVQEREASNLSPIIMESFALVVPDSKICGRTMLRGFVSGVKAMRRQLTVCDTENDIGEQANVILQLMHHRVSGVAMLPVTDPPTPDYQILQLQERGIPVVFCHRGVDGVRAPIVELDYDKGGRMQAEMLLKRGHRQVAFFAEGSAGSCKNAETGFRDTLRAGGRDLPEKFIYRGRRTGVGVADQEKAIRESLRRMFRDSNRPTAIAATWDPISEIVYLLLGQMGLRIPEDVSIIGTGDSDRDGAIIRRLASITVDEAAIGHRAVEVLQQMKNDDRPLHGEERIVMPLNFVEGETLGPVPERKSLNVDFS